MKYVRYVFALLTLALLPVAVLSPQGNADTAATAVIDRAIATGADDAEQRVSNGAMDRSSSDLELTADGNTVQTVGLRFTNIGIPRGAVVTNAYVQFRVDEVSTGTSSLSIAGQAADNAAGFTSSANNISSRPKTVASVAWAPAVWNTVNAAGVAQRTPDLSPIVNQIVSRAAWNPGNALALIITGTGRRTADAFEDGGAPSLHVEYVDPTVTTTTSTSTTTTTTSTTVPSTTVPPPTTVPSNGDVVPTPADYGFPSCTAGRTVTQPYPAGTNLTSKWAVTSPPTDRTFDLTGVTSTAQPSSSYPFAFGTSTASARTCLIGGELLDRFGPINPGSPYTWRYVHDTYNASCVKGIATDWYQILNTECRGIEDGFRPQENGVNVNNTRFMISDTYLGNVLDDCLENDYTVGGVVLDSLWDGCLNGISERPSGDRCWVTPPGETLTLDHLLMGLRPMETEVGWGYGRLFKFAKCAETGQPQTHNQLVIRCSTFLVPEARRDGGASGGAMDMPVGTTVDDSACPDNPTTIVWLGGGTTYPGNLRGLPIRTVTDISYWNARVAEWQERHP